MKNYCVILILLVILISCNKSIKDISSYDVKKKELELKEREISNIGNSASKMTEYDYYEKLRLERENRQISQIKTFDLTSQLKDSALRTELSGEYEGNLEIPACCNSFFNSNGKIYLDLTTDPITFVYDGVLRKDCYYFDKKLLYNKDNYSGNRDEAAGWFEKLNERWVLWLKSDGVDYLKDSVLKPYPVFKVGNLDLCRVKINEYLKDEKEFKVFFDKFFLAFVNSEFKTVNELINFPLVDESYYPDGETVSKNILTIEEFLRRFEFKMNYGFRDSTKMNSKEYIEQIKNHDYFFKNYNSSQINPGVYIWYGVYGFVFDKLNGEYRLVKIYDFV